MEHPRARQLQRRLDVLRDQWRAATAAGDHHHAAAIEAAARQVQADLQHPPAPPPEPATAHLWWIVANTGNHPGCKACRQATGGPEYRS